MYFILDEGHNCIAVDFAEWSAWCKVDENCEVAEDFLLGGQIRVSTVFTGIDSEALPNKPPKTFLTENLGYKPRPSGRLYILLDKYFNKRPNFILPTWDSHQLLPHPWFKLKADRIFS